jgi:hypothetical protein
MTANVFALLSHHTALKEAGLPVCMHAAAITQGPASEPLDGLDRVRIINIAFTQQASLATWILLTE